MIHLLTTERKLQNLPYFGRFIAKSWLNDLEDVGQGQKSLYMTHLLTLVVICAKYGMNPPKTVGTTERKRFVTDGRTNELTNERTNRRTG